MPSTPTITGITTTGLPVGETGFLFVLGTGFVDGAVVTFSGTGVSIDTTNFGDSTGVYGNVTVDPAATLGARDVTVTNPDTGTVTSTGLFTVEAGAAPALANDPVITGVLNVGSTLSINTGDWTGSLTIVYTYQWNNSATGDIAGQTAATYVLESGDVGDSVRCTVTATNDYGVGSILVSTTDLIDAAGSPSNTVLPVVTYPGYVVGDTLTVDTGTWTGDATITYTYSWVAGGTGLTTNSYTLQAEDVGFGPPFCVVTATNGAGTRAASSEAFGSPTITSTAPPTITALNGPFVQGTTSDCILTGTGFVTGLTVTVSGSGVTINSTTVDSSTQVTVNVTIDIAATIGNRDITVTNTDSGTFTAGDSFTIASPVANPDITDLSPDTAAQGDTLDVAVTGTGFQDGITAELSAPGITVNTVTFNDDTSLTVNITLAVDVPTGDCDFTVVNPDTGESDRSFTVTGTTSTPVITSISPTSMAQGTTGDVIFTGTGFAPDNPGGADINDDGTLTGITTNSFSYDSFTQITVNITLASDAELGVTDATMSNGDGGFYSFEGAFTVTEGSGGTAPANTVAPFITGSLVQGQTLTCNHGTWTGTPTVTYTYVWNGSAGSGLAQSYTTESGDLGSTLSCTVTATNDFGFAEATTADVGPIVAGGGGGDSGTFITSLSPPDYDEGTTGNVVVTGNGFVSGATVAIAGASVTVNSVTFNSSTSLTVNVTVAGDAGTNVWVLTVTNPDSTSADADFQTSVPFVFRTGAWRWVLTDSTVPETYTLEINPNTGGSLPLQKNISIYQLTSDDGQMVLYEGSDSPQLVVVSGTLLSESQFNSMVYWYSKRRPIQLTDDLGRTMWVYFAVWTPTRSWSYQYPWKHTWSASFYVVGPQAVTTL